MVPSPMTRASARPSPRSGTRSNGERRPCSPATWDGPKVSPTRSSACGAYVAILGGAKVSYKLEVIENLLGKVDRLLIGGAMAYTFLKSRGVPIGRSLVEDDKLDAARALEAHARTRKVRLELPVDHVVADRVGTGAAHEVLLVGDARIGDRIGVDIGPATIKAYEALIADARTVGWNGPMG